MARQEESRADSDRSERFAKLVGLTAEKAYNFAYRLAGNDQDARDLVQEAYMRALRHFDRYDQSRPFEAWLVTILHHVYLDGVRKLSHHRTVSLDSPPPVEDSSWDEIIPGPDGAALDGMIRRETDAWVQRALALLPLQYRTAVTLCDIEGFSYEKISEVMSCPIGTVRSRIHQGRLLMRKALEGIREGKGESHG